MKIGNSTIAPSALSSPASSAEEVKKSVKTPETKASEETAPAQTTKSLQQNAQQSKAQLSLSGGLLQKELQSSVKPELQRAGELSGMIGDISAGTRDALGVPSPTTGKGIDVNQFTGEPNDTVTADSYSKFQDSLANHGDGILEELGPEQNAGNTGPQSKLNGQSAQIGQLEQGVRDNLANSGFSEQLADRFFGKSKDSTTRSPLGGDQNKDSGFGAADMPGFTAGTDPLQYKNAAEARQAMTGDISDDIGAAWDKTKKAAGDAYDSAKETAKEWARHVFGPENNNNEKKQLDDLEKQQPSSSMPAPDGVQPERGSSTTPHSSGPSGVVDPPDENMRAEFDAARFAARLAASLTSKINPNPNDEGRPVQSGPLTPPTPGVVDPPDDPMGSRTPAPKPKTGPHPGIGPLPRAMQANTSAQEGIAAQSQAVPGNRRDGNIPN